MEPKFRSSFIPKKTMQTASAIQKKSGGGSLGMITLIVLIITLGAVVLSVGLFVYQQILTASIDRKTDTLERARAAFEPELIEELVRLDSRLESAQTILNEHIAPSAIFSVLGASTLRSVQFNNFDLTRTADGRISISMSGVAEDFNGVALQADAFGGHRAIREPIFSNLNLNANGNAVFNVTALIDPTLVSFVNQVTTGGSN